MKNDSKAKRIHAMIADGFSHDQVAVSLQVSLTYVRHISVYWRPSRFAIVKPAISAASKLLPHTPGKAWDDATVDRIVALWREGKSGAQIAAAIGNTFTRNAVIGKIHRLGLSNRTTQTQRQAPRTPRTRARKGVPPPKRPRIEFEAGPLPAPAADDIARKGLLELENGECRWPCGDPQEPSFGFCAAPVVIGLSYCMAHARRAYMPPQPRRRHPDVAPPRQAEREKVDA